MGAAIQSQPLLAKIRSFPAAVFCCSAVHGSAFTMYCYIGEDPLFVNGPGNKRTSSFPLSSSIV